MFEGLLGGNKEVAAELAAERRQLQAVKDRDAFAAAQQNDSNYLTPQAERSDIIRWQQDMGDEIEILKHSLRSEEWSNKDQKWIKRTRTVFKDGNQVAILIPPLANELFIDYIQTQVIPFLSRNLINSNLDEKRILKILKNTTNDIADAMADGWDMFEMEFTSFDLVLRLIKNTIQPAAYRALNGWTKKQDSTTIKRIETHQENMQAQQKKGFLSGLSSS